MIGSAFGQQEASASYVVRSRIRLERETCLFALASALDFLMTWGLIGLVGFKLAMVCVIAAVCQAIASRRIGTARRVLQFASVAASAVVVYSAWLMIRHS